MIDDCSSSSLFLNWLVEAFLLFREPFKYYFCGKNPLSSFLKGSLYLWRKFDSNTSLQQEEEPEGLHVGVDDDEDEGDEEVEEQPDVDHLQVGGVW